MYAAYCYFGPFTSFIFIEESVDDACDIASHILVWRVNASIDDLSVDQSWRKGDGDMENSVEIEAEQSTGNQNEKSFIIVWQVNNA